MTYILMILIVLLDQMTKIWIQNTPAMHGHVEVIRNFLYITYVKNTGAAWSILEGKQLFLILISIVEIAVLGYFLYQFKRKNMKRESIAIALMIGGAIGNLIDRIQYNYVRDFIETYPFGRSFPIFNVADIALTIGVILLGIYILQDERSEKEHGCN